MMLYLRLNYPHLYTTVLIVLYAIVGASSRNSSLLQHSNNNKTSLPTSNQQHQWNQQYFRASFMNFLLDASLMELLKSTSKISRDQQQHQFDGSKSTTKDRSEQQQTICSLLSNLLEGNQMKFCHQHLEVLEMILPQVMQLTRRECHRITADLRWNCSSFDYLLDRSNPLAFTREAALVRSILNAAMMYLVVKTCSEHRSHRSCGCLHPTHTSQQQQQVEDYYHLNNAIEESQATTMSRHSEILADQKLLDTDYNELPNLIDEHEFSQADLSKLDSGSPLRLQSSTIHQRQGCLANTAFAAAFTKVFIDSDDIKALNKAYRILNDDQALKLSNMRRLIDSDNKDLAYIKWSKSAINLHNNHVGRQMIRQAIQRRCKCHGISGVCPYQTCWDQLLDFETITSRLKAVYLTQTSRVEVKNSGSLEKPDLFLMPVHQAEPKAAKLPQRARREPNNSNNLLSEDLKTLLELPSSSIDPSSSQSASNLRVNSRELIYLYDSPNYCEPIPQIRHPGTKGRPCELKVAKSSGQLLKKTSSPDDEREATSKGEEQQDLNNNNNNNDDDDGTNQRQHSLLQQQQDITPGSCELLCCNRGQSSELVLDMVTCNCRFKFCCNVQCDHCLRQRVQHYCL